MWGDERWEIFRRQIEVQLSEYEVAVSEAAEWWRSYQRRSKLFRAVKRNESTVEAD